MSRVDDKGNFQKIISFSYQGAKMTSEVLKELIGSYLSGDKKSQQVRYGDLAKKGKLDSIEITENNIGDFVDTAKKYDIDYALKRDSSTVPPTYHVFFSVGNAENFKKAFAEYAQGVSVKLNKQPNDKSVSDVFSREQISKNAKTISEKAAEQSKEKHLSHSDITR